MAAGDGGAQVGEADVAAAAASLHSSYISGRLDRLKEGASAAPAGTAAERGGIGKGKRWWHAVWKDPQLAATRVDRQVGGW